MPIKNYVYGAEAPLTRVKEINDQFHLMHKYRNALVEDDLDRRKASDAVVRAHCPELVAKEKEALDAQALKQAVVDEVKRQNKQASVDAARAAGRQKGAKATVAASPALRAEYARLDAITDALWDEVNALRAAGYKLPAVKEDLKPINKWHADNRKRLRAASGLYWGNYLAVEDAAESFGEGAPPEFNSWHDLTHHRVAVQPQSEVVGHEEVPVTDEEGDPVMDRKTGRQKVKRVPVKKMGLGVDTLFAGTDTRLQAVPRDLPAGQRRDSSRARKRQYVTLRFRVGTHAVPVVDVVDGREVPRTRRNPETGEKEQVTRDRPLFADVPVLMHRPLPEGARIKWAYLFRRLIGTQYRWSVMFTVDIPDPGYRHKDAAARGVCAVAFKAERLADGSVRVARWAGDDGRSGEVVLSKVDMAGGARSLPAVTVRDHDGGERRVPARVVTYPDGRFEEGERLQSRIDQITNLAVEALAGWVSGEALSLPERPFAQETGRPDCRRVVGAVDVPEKFLKLFAKPNDATPSRAQVSAWVSAWRSPGRLDRRLTAWGETRFEGDAAILALLGEWRAQYVYLENWRDHGAAQHRGWRTELFRLTAVALRRAYQSVIVVEAAASEAIVKPKRLKLEGDEYRPSPDNTLKRNAACGALRAILIEGFECPYRLPASLGRTPEEALANRAHAVSALVTREKRVRKKTKPESATTE